MKVDKQHKFMGLEKPFRIPIRFDELCQEHFHLGTMLAQTEHVFSSAQMVQQ